MSGIGRYSILSDVSQIMFGFIVITRHQHASTKALLLSSKTACFCLLMIPNTAICPARTRTAFYPVFPNVLPKWWCDIDTSVSDREGCYILPHVSKLKFRIVFFSQQLIQSWFRKRYKPHSDGCLKIKQTFSVLQQWFRNLCPLENPEL